MSQGVSEPRPRPASIRDVARLAGVSHQTVSRVLNGHASIRDVTKSRVLAAMDELQFRPSRAAQDALDPAVGDDRRARRRRRLPLRPGQQRERGRGRGPLARLLRDGRPSGVGRPRRHHRRDRGAAEPERRGDRHRRAADDGAVPARRAVDERAHRGRPGRAERRRRHPRGLGRPGDRRPAGARLSLRPGAPAILHVAGPPDWNDAQSRLRAYQAGLRAAGMPASPPLFGDWTADSGYEIGRALVNDTGPATCRSRPCSRPTTRWRSA